MVESLEIQALQARALELWEFDKSSALELGRALIAVREAMSKHGDFTKWWREHDLDENRVYYCIRKAEGKEKPTQPPVQPFFLNRRSLAVARVADAPYNAKFAASVVHVGPSGTTATDGYVIVRTSLPPNVPQPSDAAGNLSRELALRLLSDADSRNPIEVSFGKTGINATNADGVKISAPSTDQQEFPNADSLLDDLVKRPIWCKGRMNIVHLKKLIESAEAFGAEAVDVTIADNHVRFDAEQIVDDTGGSQRYFGLFCHALQRATTE